MKNWMKVIFAFISVLMIAHAQLPPAADPLKDVAANVTADFGPDSGFMYLVYFSEIVLAAVAYIKTKNLLVLPGVIVLLAFTGIAVGMLPAVL